MAVLFNKGNSAGMYITNYEELIRELNRVQPSLVTQLRAEYRQIAKPVQAAVKGAIPSEPPTSGIHKKKPQRSDSGFFPRVVPGRLTWGANSNNNNRPVDSVGIQTIPAGKARKNLMRNRKPQAAIVRLKIDNAATVMADLAGTSGKYVNKNSRTRIYPYSRNKRGYRTHRINGQGEHMITALGRKLGVSTKKSKMIYPAAEKSIPMILPRMDAALGRAYGKINRRMRG